MRNIFFTLLLFTVIFSSCFKEQGPEIIVEPPGISLEEIVARYPKENAQKILDQEYAMLLKSANTIPCRGTDEIKIVPIGAKACGGPLTYVAYLTDPKEASYFILVERLTKAQELFNKKWNIVSDCSVVQAPKKAECVNGKIILIY